MITRVVPVPMKEAMMGSAFVEVIGSFRRLLLSKPDKPPREIKMEIESDGDILSQREKNLLELVQETFKDDFITENVEKRLRGTKDPAGSSPISYVQDDKIRQMATNLGIILPKQR